MIDESPEFLNSAKRNNIGPTSVPIKAPFINETSTKNNYPDWKCTKKEKNTPFIPETVCPNLPFYGKKSNQDYGKFYEEGVPVTQFAPNLSHKPSK